MKKIIFLLTVLIVLTLLAGCSWDKAASTSTAPAYFVIKSMSQSRSDKESNVAKYHLEIWTTDSDGSKIFADTKWYTLEDNYQVGDTLKFIKI